MIRVGSGTFSGRVLEQPKTNKTRPMTQKVRASIFNRLGDIAGLRMLDAYAGSGAVGIEALSRGAHHVTFLEISRPVASVIRHNLQQLSLEGQSDVIIAPAREATRKIADKTYDIIIADPPYRELDVDDLNSILRLLANNGIFALSHAKRLPTPALNAVAIDTRTYGDTTISYYRAKIS